MDNWNMEKYLNFKLNKKTLLVLENIILIGLQRWKKSLMNAKHLFNNSKWTYIKTTAFRY